MPHVLYVARTGARVHERMVAGLVYRRRPLRASVADLPLGPPAAKAAPYESHTSAFEDTARIIERAYVERVESLEERPRFSHVTTSVADGEQATGRELLAKLQLGLNSFSCKPSKGQRLFHRNMIMAIIHKIFRTDFAENIEFLREQFATDIFKPDVLIVTARRFGKTYAVSMFVAAVAFALPATEQCIFSTGRRASKALLDRVYRFLIELPGMRERIIERNVETIRIQGPGGPNDIRTFTNARAPMSAPASDAVLRLLLDDESVRSGERDEAFAQRCALRCFQQYPTRTVLEFARTCYARCLDEDADAATAQPTVRWLAVAALLVALALAACANMPRGRRTLSELVSRVRAKKT